MEKFVIIDGNSLINRAFYALPPLKSISGLPCNAVYGFTNMMLQAIGKIQPKYLAIVFDAGKHTFRHDLYAEYKGKRDKMPEDLLTQLPMLKDLLSAMEIKMLEKKEIEADDIIGTLTRKFEAEFIIVSGDKDMLQLIDDNVTVWLTQKGISQVNEVDRKVLKEEFGLTPSQVIEMKALMGDSSDNIPGVQGVGQVGAQKLISQYGTVDELYNNINDITGKLKDKLIAGKESCYMSRMLATIKTDVEFDVKIEDFIYSMPFKAEAVRQMRELDFRSILKRKELFVQDVEDHLPENTTEIKGQLIEIDSDASFDKFISKVPSSFAISYNDMTYTFAYDDKEYVLYKSGDIFNRNIERVNDLLKNSEIHKICFDAKSLMHDLDIYGLEIKNYFDVSLAIYIANEMDNEILLKDVLKLNSINTEFSTLALIRLKEIYITKLINNMQLKLYSEIELPLVHVLFDMERIGINVDIDEIKNLSTIYHIELNSLKDKIFELAGEEFNINSPKQLAVILFEKLGIEYKSNNSTSIEVLNSIADKHEIVEKIIRYRKINKLIGTYLDGMLGYISSKGKIHTTFMQRTTSTGRLSSREPNLQNLPIRDDEGRLLRKMFKTSFDGGEMISADYNQIELRLMANFSEDENMINDYLAGHDIHTATASKVFGVDMSEVDSNMRRVAKSVNFGIIYGISGFGLSQSIGCTQREALNFIDKYMSIYPKIKDYGNRCIDDARNNGYIRTIMGRVRHLVDINSRNHSIRASAERMAKNMPLQGSASDIIKIAMIRVYEHMNRLSLRSKLVLQIHDELVVDCHPGEREIVMKILKEEMEGVANLKVPLLVNLSYGKTLYDAK